MKFLEKDLEDIIFETDNDLLNDRGLMIYGNKLRQVRIGNYGICDLITWFKEETQDTIYSSEEGKFLFGDKKTIIYLTLYELKKGEIDFSTYHQAIRYLKGIKSYLNKRGCNLKFKYRIVLVGHSFCSKSSFVYLPNIHKNVNIITYDYDFNGITFKDENAYCLIDEGFNFNKKGVF